MKWLGLFLPFIFGFSHLGASKPRKSIRESALEIFDAITLRARTAVFLYMAGLATVALICGGFFMFLLDITRQYDTNGFVTWTSTLISGMVIMAVALSGLAYVYFVAWPGIRSAESRRTIHEEEERRNRAHPQTSLEQALSALVMDFVKEREIRRSERGSTAEQPRPDEESSQRRRETSEERPSSYH